MRHGIPRATHLCVVPDCAEGVPQGRLMCLPHWELVPGELRRAVWRTWKILKLNFGDPVSRNRYNEARDAAVKAVRE